MMQSAWMRTTSLFSCALKCATQKTQTLAWQHIPRWRRRWRRHWRRRNRRYHEYGPRSTTTSTTTSTIPVCNAPSPFMVSNSTSAISFPADVTTTVLLFAADAAACCVQNITSSVGVLVVFLPDFGPLPITGNLTVSLETPDGQVQSLGVAFPVDIFFNVISNDFPGAKAGGVWKLNFLASPDATGWAASDSQLELLVEQCV